MLKRPATTDKDLDRDHAPDLRQYLRAAVRLMRYDDSIKGVRGYYGWMLDQFKDMKIERLDGKDLQYVQGVIDQIRAVQGSRFPANKECYLNCALLALFSDGKIGYVEGMCWDIAHFDHAWCVYKGRFFDLTAQWNDRLKGDRQYMGLAIPFRDLAKYWFTEDRDGMACMIPRLFRRAVMDEALDAGDMKG